MWNWIYTADYLPMINRLKKVLQRAGKKVRLEVTIQCCVIDDTSRFSAQWMHTMHIDVA